MNMPTKKSSKTKNKPQYPVDIGDLIVSNTGCSCIVTKFEENTSEFYIEWNNDKRDTHLIDCHTYDLMVKFGKWNLNKVKV